VDALTHYALGAAYEFNEQTEEALAEYHQSALLMPHDESLVLEVTRRLVLSGEADSARGILMKTTAGSDASAAVFARLGEVETLLNHTNAAIKANRTAIRKEPDQIVGYENLTGLHLRNGEPDKALEVIRDAAARKRPGIEFLVALTELYARYVQKQPERAEELRAERLAVLDRLDDEELENPFMLLRVADAFNTLGDAERAAPVYLRLLEHAPEFPTVRAKLAEIYLRADDKEEAVRHLEALVREDPRNARAYYFLGTLANDAREYAEAADYFRRALTLDPGFEQTYYDLTAMQINSGNAQAALETLEQARQRFAASFVMEYYSGLAHHQLQNYGRAIRHFTAAEISARSNHPERLTPPFYFQLGAVHERNQDYSQAESYFRKALELEPDFAEALNYLGYMWAERGENLEEARRMIERAVELEPGNAAYLDSLGWVLFQMDRPEEALPWMLKAVEHLEQSDATVYDHLGDVYRRLDKPAKARDAYVKALQVEANPGIQRKLEELSGE
jgi:tetratricopeptide (TPR) repeat protein